MLSFLKGFAHMVNKIPELIWVGGPSSVPGAAFKWRSHDGPGHVRLVGQSKVENTLTITLTESENYHPFELLGRNMPSQMFFNYYYVGITIYCGF